MSIRRDWAGISPDLKRKVEAVCADVTAQLEDGWELRVFETWRSEARQIAAINAGNSRIKLSAVKKAPHVLGKAADVVFWKQGSWSWGSPPTKDGRKAWDLVHSAKLAHGLKNMRFKTFVDDPHLELP
jgi:hypothetical protein